MEIYLDNAASTAIDPLLYEETIKHIKDYGNPSCIHLMGQFACALIKKSRKLIADKINAKPHEVIFTAGGTESNNLALQGYVYANSRKGNHIITTAIEHSSILNTCKYLEHIGYDVTYLPVNKFGMIDLDELEDNIYDDTILISIIFANNEIGSVQNIKDIGIIAHQYGIRLHTDAVQAIGHYKMDINALGIDMMSISGHKIYSSKGIGALYVNEHIRLEPLCFGGRQEYGLRAGTENTLGIVCIGKAVEMLDYKSDIAILRDKLKQGISEHIKDVVFNSPHNGLPSILNVSFRGVNGKNLTMELSKAGIYVSDGAACTSQHSHVLKAIGLTKDLADSSIRFSFGKYNTIDEINHVLNVLPDIIERLKNHG